MIKRLHSFSIRAADVKSLAAFYRGTLGLKVHREDSQGVAFDLGQGQWLLVAAMREEGLAKAQGAPASTCGIGFLVDDVDALYRKLKSSVRFPKPPSDEDWGGRTVTGFDPEGNKLNFIQLKS